MEKSFDEIFKEFIEKIEERNNELSKKKLSIVSKEMLSILVSECIVEDINHVITFKKQGYLKRYTDAIIRNMCEQTIEYIYIIKHQDLLKEYFGEKILIEDDDFKIDELKGTELFEELKQTGASRFTKGRKSVSEMAKDIGEFVTTDGKISLYTIFSNKAELEHNSYFHHIFNVIGEIEDDVQSDDNDNIYITYVIIAFLKTYSGI